MLGVRNSNPRGLCARGEAFCFSAPFPPVRCNHGSPEKGRVHKLLTCGQAFCVTSEHQAANSKQHHHNRHGT